VNYVELSKIERLTKDVKKFLKVIGVYDFPRVLQLGDMERWGNTPAEIPKERWQAYWSWLSKEKHFTYPGRDIEYEGRNRTIACVSLDGFEECVLSADTGRLTRYLNFLLEHWDDYYKHLVNSTYRWFYYYPNNKEVPSYFAYQLKNSRWLSTTGGLSIPDAVLAPLREMKRLGGKLVPYVKISEEQARQGKEFLQFLGVRTEVDLRTLLSILSEAREAPVNDVLKAQLGEVYRRMANLSQDESISQEVYILDRKGNYQPSRALYWLDDSETDSVFGEEVPAVWVPDSVSRPDIEALFSALGVARISSILERRRIDDGQGVMEDIDLKNRLKEKGNYLYSVLLHYKAGRVAEFSDFIRKVTIVRVNPLKLQLTVLDKAHEIQVPCFCSIEENRLYISSNVQEMDVAREIARVFNAPAGSEFTLSFVLMQVPDRIIQQLTRSSIQLVPIAESSESEVASIVEPERPIVPTEQPLATTEPIVSQFRTLPITRPRSEALVKPSTEGAEKIPEPEVSLDIDTKELVKEIDDMKQLLTEGRVVSTKTSDVWREARQIDKVVSKARVVVRPFVSASTEKNWELRTVDSEKVYVEVGMDAAKIDAVKPLINSFRQRMRRIIDTMGGNPETVNVCIVDPVTDGDRRGEQLFFNLLRTDKPLRWIVVAARELAYVKFPNPSQAHISLMTDLIEKALERIKEIYPDVLGERGGRAD